MAMRRRLPTFFVIFIVAIFACHNQSFASDKWHVRGYPAVLSQHVEFSNAGAILSGTLYRPDVSYAVPAIVVLHGAEVPRADADLYTHLREGVTAMGMAVLIFDRRGSGQSTGSMDNISYETLADDGIAGARAISVFPFIDAAHIGYWGLSQGGWLTILAADRDSRAAFAISVSAPLVTPEQQMEFAMSNRLQLLGYSPSDVSAMLAARSAWTGYLRGSIPRADAVAALRAIDHKPWFDLMYMPSASELTPDPAKSSWRKEMDDDPFTAVQSAKVPILLIYGGADPWIPVSQTIQRLKTLASTHAGITYAIIAEANHTMMFVPKETMDANPKALQTAAPQAPAYFMLMSSWLGRHGFTR
ncbi:MAG: alpha/beta hydrolase [Acidobacteriaceae bacterium]